MKVRAPYKNFTWQILHQRYTNMTTTINIAAQKWHTLCNAKKYPNVICQGQLRWVIFKCKFLNLLYHSDSWSLDFKVKFRPLQRNIPTTLLCLIAGVYYISRVSVVPQKTNNVVVGCHYLCWVPFFQGRFFNKRGALFLTLWQWVP